MADSCLCSVEGCGKKRITRGWCHMHYQRWRHTGSPQVDKLPKTWRGEAQRFYDEVVLKYEGDECLIWPYKRGRHGYGTLGNSAVSRLLCIDAYGPPPTPQHQGAHGCGKGHLGCVTKKHLRWATCVDNHADRVIHGTSPRGAQNGRAKVTDADVLAIRELSKTLSSSQIAMRYGISRGTVWGIVTGRYWPHIKAA